MMNTVYRTCARHPGHAPCIKTLYDASVCKYKCLAPPSQRNATEQLSAAKEAYHQYRKSPSALKAELQAFGPDPPHGVPGTRPLSEIVLTVTLREARNTVLCSHFWPDTSHVKAAFQPHAKNLTSFSLPHANSRKLQAPWAHSQSTALLGGLSYACNSGLSRAARIRSRPACDFPLCAAARVSTGRMEARGRGGDAQYRRKIGLRHARCAGATSYLRNRNQAESGRICLHIWRSVLYPTPGTGGDVRCRARE